MKTIELDNAAFARLKAARRENESWSDVIKRYVRPKASVEEMLTAMQRAAASVSSETIEVLDQTVTRRRRQPRRHP
jgi:predicted CopG family antitoxin